MNRWNKFKGRTWLMMDIYRLLVWMLFTDVVDGTDHMIVVDDYHGLV